MDEKKLEVMKRVVDGERSISWAAAKLKRSEKTIRRYRKELLENPNADLVHKNRGREPANKADHELIWNLYCTKYYGMNITFFCEKLKENFNRSTHIVRDYTNQQIRILTPKETERIQGFPDDWTNTGMPEKFRYFCMGNALVVPLISRMEKNIENIFINEP